MLQLTVLAIFLGVITCSPVDNLYLPPIQGVAATSASGASQVFKSNGLTGAIADTYSSSNVKQVPILKFSTENDGAGTYSYSYEAGNTITAEEQGAARGDGTKAHGSYSFTLPDGQHVSLTYTADENGFVAHGSHIPTALPIPEAILRALEENAAAEARGIFDDGQYHGEGLEDGEYKEVEDSGSVGVDNGGYKY